MEEAIINWLVAIVENEDRVNEWIENEKASLRSQGKTLVDSRYRDEDLIYYDYITGEPIPEEQLSRGGYWNVDRIEEHAYDVHPYPQPPKGLEWLLRDADFEAEDARRWINENVMPL